VIDVPKVKDCIAKWIGRQDNNVAEYLALLEALPMRIRLRARAIHVYSRIRRWWSGK